jgi:threonine/homoserine/homoserine lactone efflux protein
MVAMDTLASLLVVAALAVLVSGPDTFVVLRTSLTEGARAGTWAAAGSAAGNLVWGAASVLGGAALLHTSATAFSALKLLGAASRATSST